jgi:type IV secretion system protein VirB1
MMMISPALILACAAQVAPATLQAIVQVESGGDPYVVNIVGVGAIHAHNASEAIARTQRAVAQGHNVAMGLMQVTTQTATRLGYAIPQLFQPCTNLRAGAQVLTENYRVASRSRGEGQTALQAALSAYNTGNFLSGFSNGYVALYYSGKAGKMLSRGRQPAVMTVNPYTAPSAVFIRQVLTHDTTEN